MNISDSNIIVQPKFNKIAYGQNTFKYYSKHIWNILSNDIKKSTNITTFRY